MRRIWVIIYLLALMTGGRAAFGDSGITVSLPAGSPRPGAWQMLLVQWNPQTAGEVTLTLQDARGGPAVSREVTPGTGPARALLSLPLLDAASLANGRWKITATIASVVAGAAESTVAEIPIDGASSATRTLQFVVPEGQRVPAQEAGPWTVSRFATAQRAEVPEEEILDAPAAQPSPALIAMMIPQALRSRLTEARVKAFLAIGTQIALLGGPPGDLDRLGWEKVNDGAGRLAWISLVIGPKPAVIEPGLGDLVDWRKPATAQPHDMRITYWFGPAAVVLVILSYELFRRRSSVLLAWVIALCGLSVVAVRIDDANTANDIVRTATWSQSPPDAPVALRESLQTQSPLFAKHVSIAASSSAVLYPIAAAAREYWNWRGLTLHLGDGVSNSPIRLEGTLPARSVPSFETRTAEAMSPGIPAFRVFEGYVSVVHNDHTPAEPGAPFSTWADTRPIPEQSALKTWYALRFNAAHLYLLTLTDDPDDPLHVVDQGASPDP